MTKVGKGAIREGGGRGEAGEGEGGGGRGEGPGTWEHGCQNSGGSGRRILVRRVTRVGTSLPCR